MASQALRLSQRAQPIRGPLAQDCSGNKKPATPVTVVASGFITPTGAAGSEYGFIDMTQQKARVGDWIVFFLPKGDGVNSNGTVGQHTGAAFATEVFAWSHGVDGFASYRTLDENHLKATAMRVLCRDAFKLYYCILRSADGTPTVGAVKEKVTPSSGAYTVLNFAGYTKAAKSKGHVVLLMDRDPGSQFLPANGHLMFDQQTGQSILDTFSRASYLFGDPGGYPGGGFSISCAGAQTWGQAGIVFEFT